MAVDPHSLEPPYLQIAASLRRVIESGELAPGARLPSLNRLAQEWQVSKGTVVRAVAVLADAGLVESRQGWGTFVKR